MSEKDTLQAVRNRLINTISSKERELSKLRETLKAAQTLTAFSEQGLQAIDIEGSEAETPKVEEGPTGKELVNAAIKEWQAANPGKDFRGADLSKIIRTKGLWNKKTPLANMVFMSLKRMVEAKEVESLSDGVYRAPEQPSA
jgi:hypothetical protein